MVVWPDDLESKVPNKDVEQRTQAANSHRFKKHGREICKLSTDVKNSVERVD
jgi:hypothetical protein